MGWHVPSGTIEPLPIEYLSRPVVTVGMASEQRWRWSNVPVPRVHAAALLAGVTLHRVRPWTLPVDRRWSSAVGLGLLGGGLFVVGWSVRTVERVDVGSPDSLVTDGPYAHSRNPMYVGWTGLYAGVVLLMSSVWLLLALPVVLVCTHAQIRREERSLGRAFGDEYDSYRQTVSRYR